MIRKMTALACAGTILAGSAAPTVAQDAAPRVFTRSGQWQLEAADEECRIARVFTNGDQQIALALERNRADPLARMVLVTNALSTYRRADELGYKFEPAGEQRSARYITAEMADGQTYYNLGNVLLAAMPSPPEPGTPQPVYDRAAEQAYAAGITGIEFNAGLTQPVRLETGSLRAAITALQACEDDLLRTWGLDWEKHQTMTRRATPDGQASDWIPTGTIGFGDFAALSAGRNPFRVMVSAEGRPTDCKALWASLDASKNERVCNAIMQHGRFLPALDAAGQPMASYWMVDYLFGLAPPPPGR
jgi:hypothetical protein